MVILVVAGFGGVMLLAMHEFWIGGITGLVAACGLGLSLYSEKKIKLTRSLRAKAIRQEVAVFNESSLIVPFRWVRWIVSVVFLCSVGLLLGVVSLHAWYSGKLMMTLFLGMGFLAMVSCLVNFVVSAKAALQSGFALKADPFGLALAGLPVIGWRDIRGVDLRVSEVNGQKQSILVFALDTVLWNSIKQRLLPWPFRGQTILKGGRMELPCFFLAKPGELLLQAIHSVADRYGARRVKDWKYFLSIDDALKHEEIREQIQEADLKTAVLFEQLKKMSDSNSVDEKKVAEIDHQLQVQFQKMSSASTVQMESFKTLGASHLQMAKWFVWGMYVLLALVIGGAILKVVMVLRS